jgi:hypothetical protein
MVIAILGVVSVGYALYVLLTPHKVARAHVCKNHLTNRIKDVECVVIEKRCLRR